MREWPEEMPGAEELSWALWPRTMGSPETGEGFVTLIYTLFFLHFLKHVRFQLVSLFHNHHVVFHRSQVSVTCQAEKALCPAPTRLLSKTKKEIIVVVCSVAIRASWGHFWPHNSGLWCPSKTSSVPDLFFSLGGGVWQEQGMGTHASRRKISHQMCKWDWHRNDFA